MVGIICLVIKANIITFETLGEESLVVLCGLLPVVLCGLLP